MSKLVKLLRERWQSRRIYFVYYLLSPTLLFADYRKYCAGPEPAAVTATVKRLNLGFLTATTACVFLLLLFDLAKVFTKPAAYPYIIVAAIGLYALARCNEIFVAFVRDATSHLRPERPATDLKYYERVRLAMRSYVELVLDYAVVYYAISAASR